MRSGAECQKRLFFEFNKPIGSEEEPAGDYSCDAMHFLAVQYGNLQRFASYISLGGLDVNALATNTNTNRVIRLYEYLKEWIEKNVSDSQSTNEHKKYYKKMLEMVRLTAKSFHAFVSSEMNQMISKRLQERSKIIMELTYPHVLRCSPYNNESMDGDGNQVLSCLFYPEHSGYKDGLDTIAVNEKDKENLKELKAIHQRFRKIVSEERGRLILALYRVNIKFAADITRKYELPIFEHERSDEGFKISRMTLLRQIQVDDPELVDIELIEFKPLSTPGCRYFMVEKVEQEARLIVPGNAHIEIQGEFEKPMTFATQVFLMKKDAT
ncbi:hypothetical protein CAEBREN_22587 [Caenorhabditis brenneri]|uniref:Uncharacterized protein n=1 Tax=Caenorhabditis brenneri TaxID=135651 RepID=G0NA96_CAEBE|nr:hypothetical protein CAEBREN_22587 [Caenorhabditis brenneri]